jgi:hypothetical protein
MNRRTLIFAAAGVLLAIPALAMLLGGDVNWDVFDFIIGAILLFGTTFALNFTLDRITSPRNRVVAAGVIVLVLVLVLVWAELAVGLFGTPFAGS